MNARATVVATTKPGESSPASVASSALSEAVNNVTPATSTTNSPPSALKLPTTYQLVNVNPLSSTQTSSPRFTTTTTTTTIPIGSNSTFTKATPVIQRIQSIHTANTSQPITKTIVSTSTNINASTNINNNNTTQPNSTNYKVLTQQLPPSNTPVITQINSLKSLSTNTKIQNPIVITKTVSSSGASITKNTDFNNESTALNTTNSINRKQIITSVKNDSKRPVITTTTTTTTTTTPITLTSIANNTNNGSLSTRIEANNNSNNINTHGIENDKNKSYVMFFLF